MTTEREPIGVIGTGYVGLVTAAGFAELGSEVWCVDIDEAKIAGLNRGEIPIYEPGLEEIVARHRDRLHFSTHLPDALERARLLFVAVGTPPTYSGDADLSAVFSVVDSMPASDRHALIMKSTVPVGTGASVQRRFAATGKDGLAYVSCPEFLKEGTALADFLNPDRVVIGDEGDWAGQAVADLYAPLKAPTVRMDIRSAEMVKLASNAFLATKISFINEIANVCEETGADVVQVAHGMGLDDRIGPKFLQAGIGFGGSCFHGDETLLVRLRGKARLVSFSALWSLVDGGEAEAVGPDDLEIYTWVPGEAEPEWHPARVLTRRAYDGDVIELRTKMGRRLTVTADHPILVGGGATDEWITRMPAGEVGTDAWVPLAMGSPTGFDPRLLPLGDAIVEEGVLVRPRAEAIDALSALPTSERAEIFAGHPRPVSRMGDVRRQGSLRLGEACAAGMDLSGAAYGTTGNGAFLPADLIADEHFWRVVGLYLAEGCVVQDGNRCRISWSFHPEREDHLVDDVVSYWQRLGVEVRVHRGTTAKTVKVSSRLLARWWTDSFGLGRNSYEQRLPDLIWEQTHERKRALLSGLWEGDGSWSLVNGGPSVILEFGTVSDELADGVARLLGDLGIVCAWRRGRTVKSTKTTHWLRVSGAEQVERAIFLVPERDRVGVRAALGQQAKRIAPTGFRRFGGDGSAWVRVVETIRSPFRGHVYSLEVPGSHTVVTSGGLTTFQCFPKDVTALKQLAGNSGYHFQLLNSVIEVNELQKRRVMQKLQKHLGPLQSKRIALLGLAFKPNTDDMREASSLVLSSRLLGEGATVSAYDPVAEEEARKLIHGVDFAASALDAVDGADAVVLVTEWPEFGELDLREVAARMQGTLLVDGRNFFDPARVQGAGLVYEGIGRPTSRAPESTTS